MSSTIINSATIQGVGFWADILPDWPAATKAFRHERAPLSEPLRRPAPVALAAAERRRAPDTVCIAMQAAGEAVASANVNPRDLACVFTSSQGDLGLTDYMCETLARDPSSVSPTRFHNSVHNAPVGYWSIAQQANLTSTAISAFNASFAAGLLEALTICAADEQPVLFCAYDVAAVGSLAQVTQSQRLVSFAAVLAPKSPLPGRFDLDWSLIPATQGSEIQSDTGRLLSVNAIADGIPFCEELALSSQVPVILQLGSAISLSLSISVSDRGTK